MAIVETSIMEALNFSENSFELVSNNIAKND